MDKIKYTELSSFLTINEWKNMSEYDRKRNYNILENYKVLHSLGLSTKKPDFMCVTKRKSGEKKWSTGNKRVKFRHQMKRKDVEVLSMLVKFVFKVLCMLSVLYRQIVGLSALNEAIKKLECELQSLVEAENVFEKKTEDSQSRYPKRSVTRKDYTEGHVPNDDDFIFCDDCGQEWEGDCPVHGALTVVEDTKVPADPEDSTRADRTVPSQLYIAQSGISGAGRGVWSRVPLSKGLRFGPYEGAKVKSSNSNGYCWQIRRNYRALYCVDAKNCGIANWMRYVNCARHEEEQNLMAFQYKGEMYYRTVRPIPAHVELLVWYGDEYGRELGIVIENFHKPQQKKSLNVSQCVGCNITYSSPVYLERHEKYCRGLNNASLSNNGAFCDVKRVPNISKQNEQKRYNDNNVSGDMIHIKQPHIIDDGTCDGISSHHSDFSKHVQDRLYHCHDCDKGLTFHSHFVHMRIHTAEKSYECKECGRMFSRIDDLRTHMRIHTGEKPYECKECGHVFSQTSNLRRHMRIHTGEKPYECKECGRMFSQIGALRRHMRIHTGEKPYECKECGRMFSQTSNLRKHMRIHTGEKPYECKECGRMFSQTSNLRKHMRIHTGEKPYECEE
ncbi:hypothetical protein B7P43_G09560 [Cryptotermes secundus]|uniref:Histone-lysine N-methyltransferase PRDM9 n=1 Tax=Cryptotermes secundus TaxID=105785 RepID=A0A2J7RQ93_9NEOP|nr:hypothetical protein B7P43_G09560 [Cryptotermes secundus]